jgi:hypothetical protein
MKDETVLLNKFKLDRFSPLTEDVLLLKIDLAKYRQKKAPLFFSTILGLFENKKELIIIFYLPELGQHLAEIVINRHRYPVQLHEEDGYVHKYAVNAPFKPGKLDVNEYIFIDDSLKKTTLSVKEEHVFGILNDQYYYDSKKYFQTQLVGELLHDVIDMATIQNKVEDFLGRPFLYKDISSLKAKAVKLYYVAFNLYDKNLGRYFVPEDIVEMKVSYEEKRYVFQAKKQTLTTSIDPTIDGQTYLIEKKETIQKEKRKITSGEKSDWNIIQNFFTYKQYRYQAIYRLTDKVNLKQKEAANFSYVLVIGPKNGYRMAKEVFRRGKTQSFDFEETTLSHIKIYHLTYQEQGHRYAVPVQSLVYESDKKSRLPRIRHRIKRIFQLLGKILSTPINFVFGAGGLLIKLIKFIYRHWKALLIILILALALYLGAQIARFFEWI